MNLAGIVLAFLLPVGVMMVAWGGLSPEQSRRAASVGLLALAVSAIAYWAAGFAFQFGGIWHVTPLDAYRPLDQFWSVPDPSGPTWSVIGLAGFVLSNQLGPEATTLFLHQLPLVMTATMIPMLALAGRVHHLVTVIVGLTVALVVTPLVGHWVWANGWLAALGQNLRLGHGYVDMAGSGAVYLIGGLFALLGLWIVAGPHSSDSTSHLPRAHRPLLAVFGAILFGLGWMGWTTTDPFHPASASLNLSLGMTNGLLAAAAATIISQIFSWFSTSRVDPLMAARGWLAGWVIASASAPFIEAWSALALGALAGLVVPIIMYVIDRLMHLDDATGAVSVYGLPGLLGALAVGVFASGRWGAGWNGVGAKEYLLVAGQGVSGLTPASGFASDSGQITAQLAGVGAIAVFALIVGGSIMLTAHLVTRGWPSQTTGAHDLDTDAPRTDFTDF